VEKVPVPWHESERSCSCVSGISILHISTILIFDRDIVPSDWYVFFLFHYTNRTTYICIILVLLKRDIASTISGSKFCLPFRSTWVKKSLAIVLSVLLRYTDSDYPYGVFWPLCCLFFFVIRILITPLIYFGHCVVCSSSLYGFWLPRWYLFAIVLSVLLRSTSVSWVQMT
jgi:hypothetical protein